MNTHPHAVTITIINSSNVWRQLLRIWAVFNGVVVPIGIGILVDSAAMQWAGFILGLFIMMGLGKAAVDPRRYTSVQAAKDALDAMRERGEAP